MRWPKYWSFSFSIIPSKEIPGLISFRMDWLDVLAVQGTLKSLLQHHSSKASILWHSAFFTVHLSHPYITTGKTIALTRRTLVGKVMSLLLIMAESEEELKSLLMKVKEESKSWLQAQHSENEDHGIWPHHFMGNRRGTVETVSDFILGGLQNHCRW